LERGLECVLVLVREAEMAQRLVQGLGYE
jgi:hypothetical protein